MEVGIDRDTDSGLVKTEAGTLPSTKGCLEPVEAGTQGGSCPGGFVGVCAANTTVLDFSLHDCETINVCFSGSGGENLSL